MTSDFEILAGPPNRFSCAQLDQFIALVLSGGQVAAGGLRENIERAKLLLFLMSSQGVVGAAALKAPRLSYRTRIADKSETDIPESSFPYELGYVFIDKNARGRKQASRLIARAIELEPHAGIFATSRTDNSPMVAVLAKHGFREIGKHYPSEDHRRRLQLFVRLGTAPCA